MQEIQRSPIEPGETPFDSDRHEIQAADQGDTFSGSSWPPSRCDRNNWIGQSIAESRSSLDDAMGLLVVAQFSP